ncbi:MAG TPA: sulfite exporter TauE/SafE family protein [Bryobacteraceae bacterium]|nr:sulfite exporter TauE/SafE family protein [Bryobacteraceae bacterium]
MSSIWLFAVSAGASALGGMLGMAGGIFIVPILAVFGHIEIHTAIGASIVSVIACSSGSAAAFLEEGLTNIRLAVVLEMATTAGALTGVLMAGIIPVPYLFALFALVLLVSARQMLARRKESVIIPVARHHTGWASALRLDSSYPDRGSGTNVAYRVQRVPVGLGLMYGAGMISALLGIGSGVLKIPAMDTALRLPIKVSCATSNFMIGVTAAASAGAYFMRGNIVPGIAGPVALGSVVGSMLGARILIVVAGEKLRILFVIVLVALAVQMLLSAFGINAIGLSE